MAKVIEMKRSEARTQTIQVGSDENEGGQLDAGVLAILAACLLITSPIIYGFFAMAFLGK